MAETRSSLSVSPSLPHPPPPSTRPRAWLQDRAVPPPVSGDHTATLLYIDN